jgi:hypothetical protein
VGGFGASDYLQQQLEFTLELWKIKFRTPEESWTSVVRGGVVCGIEKTTITNLKRSTRCRHSYAICLDELFSEYTHSKDDMVESRQNKIAQAQLTYLLNEGDVVLLDEPRVVEREFDFSFPRSRTGVITFPIYRHSASEGEERPTRFKNARDGQYYDTLMCFQTLTLSSEFEVACTLEINLARIVRNCEKQRGWGLSATMCRTTLKLVMTLDGNDLRASLEWKGEVICHDYVEY